MTPSTIHVLNVHAGNIFGGVETIMLSVVRQRALCPGMVWNFALCFQDRLSRELEEAGATVEILCPVRVRRPWSVLSARARLGELLRTRRVDVAACHSAWAQAIFGGVLQAHGLPQLLWVHNRIQGGSWPERWSRRVAPHHLLCVSHDTAATREKLYPGVPWDVIYAPLPPQPEFTSADRAAVRQELNTPESATVIIQVSRMESWKGQDLHLRAIARLKNLPDWICWQVGGAQRPEEVAYVDSLKRLAAELGIADRVRFLGKRSDVPRLLAAADLMCQPNRDTEGFSITFMESFSAGLPIVTSDIGGAREIIDANTGFLLPVGDLDAIVSAMRRLLGDAALRAQLGRAARQRVRDLCDPAQQLRQYLDLFSRLASRKAPGGR